MYLPPYVSLTLIKENKSIARARKITKNEIIYVIATESLGRGDTLKRKEPDRVYRSIVDKLLLQT